MELKKPTIKRCIDGEDHIWMVVNEDTDIIDQKRWQRRWCKKCGSLTQVYIDDHGEAVALLNEKKNPHIVLTQLTIQLTKRVAKPTSKSKTNKTKGTSAPKTTRKTSKK